MLKPKERAGHSYVVERIPIISRSWFAPMVCLVVLVLFGTIGYMLVEDFNFLDGLYMTVITLATVGYREVRELSTAGKIFTIALIVFGVSTAAWVGRKMVETLWWEEMSERRRMRGMHRRIEDLKDHFIVCGYGRIGREVSLYLSHRDVPHTVIEPDAERVAYIEAEGGLFIHANAHEDAALRAAGIDRASGLVAAAGSDAENIFIVLSARGLNPGLFIVARSSHEENVSKLERAGANRVFSPYVLGGRRMAAASVHPTASDFIDLVTHTERLEFELVEMTLSGESPVAGRTLSEADLHVKTGAAVLARRSTDGRLTQVTPTTSFEAGDTLVALGTADQLERLRGLL